MTATRTSPAEVRGLFRRVVTVAEAAGIERLLELNEFAGVWSLTVGREHPQVIGHSPREASLTLSGMVRALELVAASKEVAQ